MCAHVYVCVHLYSFVPWLMRNTRLFRRAVSRIFAGNRIYLAFCQDPVMKIGDKNYPHQTPYAYGSTTGSR